MNTKSGHSK
ncbi:hypothetical protein Zm00014a_014860 [Zea mays]|uniref:Uncharacterized protein n=1 Tax=Zea mays TaxID=4577 RepID=A0A317Y8R0_MAIZE|nr:hypothetical protein Zm00014a_014860 [Zea mays]